MFTISAELTDLLKAIDYPAHPGDLVREAAREGICESELSRLAQMTPRSYSGRFDVVNELRWNHAATLLPTIQPSVV